MYARASGLLLGFHGCDKALGERLLSGELRHLDKSQNDYDWLGHGVYFWEGDPARALRFAEEQSRRSDPNLPKVTQPFVVGAVIDPGNCLNLLESESLRLLKKAYGTLEETLKLLETPMPENRAVGIGDELLLRNLDCAVVEALHTTMKTNGRPPYDTVRGLFPEGKPLYPNAGFREKDHIQICVRNTAQILGYFRPLS